MHQNLLVILLLCFTEKPIHYMYVFLVILFVPIGLMGPQYHKNRECSKLKTEHLSVFLKGQHL